MYCRLYVTANIHVNYRMQGTQISFFPNEDEHNPSQKQKKPKLGRYERIQRELDEHKSDPY